MKSKLLLVSLLMFGATDAPNAAPTGTFALLPPQYLRIVVVAVDPDGTRVRVDEEYSIYITRNGESAYSALLTDRERVEIYRELPVRTQDCDDSSVMWPDLTIAHLKAAGDAAAPRAELVAYARALKPCVLVLDLPLTAQSPLIPAKPNPGIPK